MSSLTQQQQKLDLKQACIQFLFAYQQRNVPDMLTHCAPTATVFFEPLGEAGHGKIHELGRQLWESLIDSFPDLDNNVDAAVSEEGNAVRCQVLISGTQQKEFAGIENRGLRFESDHIFIFHLDDQQQITHLHISWNHEDFRRQLGDLS